VGEDRESIGMLWVGMCLIRWMAS